MNTEEKAKQLAIKFASNIDVIKPNVASIKMALLCVDEQMQMLKRIGTKSAEYEYNDLQEVKEQLTKMKVLF